MLSAGKAAPKVKPRSDAFTQLATTTKDGGKMKGVSTMRQIISTAVQFTVGLTALAGVVVGVNYAQSALSIGPDRDGVDGLSANATAVEELTKLALGLAAAFASFNQTVIQGADGVDGVDGAQGPPGVDGAPGATGTFDGSTIESPTIHTPTITGLATAEDIQSSGTIAAANVTSGSATFDRVDITDYVRASHIHSLAGSLRIGDSANTTELYLGTGARVNAIYYGTGEGATRHVLGGPLDEVVINGALFAVNTTFVTKTNLAVTDATIIVNNGGLVDSSGLAGLYVEDGGDNSTICVRQSATLDSWQLKSKTGPLVVLNQDLQVAASVQFNQVTTTTLLGTPNLALGSTGNTVSVPAALQANAGLAVTGGVSTDTLTASGLLTANGGISTSNLNASGLINANAGLAVAGDLSTGTLTATGAVAANAGLTVTGAINTDTLAASGIITANGGLTTAGGAISTGTLAASGLLTASAGIDVTGTLTASGAITANGGLTVTGVSSLTVGGVLNANGGLTVTGATSTDTLTASGLITANAGVTVSGTTTTAALTASGLVTASAGLAVTGALSTGTLTASGLITASAGVLGFGTSATVDIAQGASHTTIRMGTHLTAKTILLGATGSTVSVPAALTVAGGVTLSGATTTAALTASGLVTANAGLTVTGATSTGTIAASGLLSANGGLIFPAVGGGWPSPTALTWYSETDVAFSTTGPIGYSGSALFVRIGRQVSMRLPAFNPAGGGPAGTFLSTTAIVPVGMRPSVAAAGPVFPQGDTTVVCVVTVNAAGVFEISYGAVAGTTFGVIPDWFEINISWLV